MAEDLSTKCCAYTVWLMVLCVAGRDDLAFALAEELGDQVWRGVPGAHLGDYALYQGLAAATLARSARGRTRRRYAGLLARSIALVEDWSRHGPDFVHMGMLLQSARAHAARDLERADPLYPAAARAAQAQDSPHYAALAHERRADLLREAGRLDEAKAALTDAIERYGGWGVPAKVACLEATLAELETR